MLAVTSKSDSEETSSEPESSNQYSDPLYPRRRKIAKKRKTLTSKGPLSSDSCPGHTSEAQPLEQEETFSSSQCLFCNLKSASLETNLTHMSLTHGFFIPKAEYLIDTSSLLSYLFIIVSKFHECLLCGSTKITKLAVQDHMRGKCHCRVDFEDEKHQLWQFYDFSEEVDSDDGDDEDQAEEQDIEKVTLVPDGGELRLPSGKILGHRLHKVHVYRNPLPTLDPSPVSSSNSQQQHPNSQSIETTPVVSNDRRIVMRASASMSMIGVTELQQRALMAVEKQMEKIETRTRSEYLSKVERGGNKQKRYRVLTMGKKAGGLEKRCG